MTRSIIPFLFLITLFCLQDAIGQQSEKPNVVFVLADDLGYADINSFDPLHRGYYETPNIDRLARQGVKFTQAYTNAANCSPTRAALISGQYYPRQPIYHAGNPFQGKMIPAPNAHVLPREKVTLAEAMKAAGYSTAFIGKWHIGDPPETGPIQQGFDINIGGYNAGNPGSWEGGYFQPNNNKYIDDAREGEYLTDYLTRKAIEYIEDHQQTAFYLQLSYYTPHSPFQAPEHLVEKYKQKQGVGGHNDPTYAAMIESLDTGVEKLMDSLDRLGLADNTIFIFYSDNGGRGGYGYLGREDNDITSNAPLKGGKTTFYEGGIRVPLAVRWPKVIGSGQVSQEPVMSIDFYPTLLEAAGAGSPAGYPLDGVSFMPVLRDTKVMLEERPLYWHFPGYPNNPWRTGPVSVIRKGPWKLMKFYETAHVELYNLQEDIGEQNDLHREETAVSSQLQKQLESWLRALDAPMPQKRH